MSRVHIIGAGFSGLSLAYFLSKHGIACDIFEKRPRAGGMIGTEKRALGLAESAANGMLNSELVEDFFADLNIQKAESNPAAKARYIYRDGRVHKWPLTMAESFSFIAGLIKVTMSPSTGGVRRDEAIEPWVGRQFGRSAFDYLFAPGLRGIFASCDLDAELIYKSVRKKRGRPSQGLAVSPKRKIKRGTVAPVGGMQEIIDKLVSYIEAHDGVFHYSADGDWRRSHPTVFATSAPAAALLLVSDAPEAARLLAAVEYLPLTTATVFFAKSAEHIRGFGCLFPPKENFNCLGVLLNNSIYQNRSSEHSETWMLNRADLSDEEVLRLIHADRQKLYGKQDVVLDAKITKWPHAVPHYNANLRKILTQLELPPQTYLTGNYLGGLGLGRILEYNYNLAQDIKNEII